MFSIMASFLQTIIADYYARARLSEQSDRMTPDWSSVRVCVC